MVRSNACDRLPPQVRQRIKGLIDAKRTEASISVSDLAREVHRAFPNSEMEEPSLRAAIAGAAVQAGLNVDFDSSLS